jgi:acyl-coenzyme A synthetase/AMP-(fatty) acid ligase
LYLYREFETTAIIRDCRARALFVTDTLRNFDHLRMALNIRSACPSLEHVVLVRPTAKVLPTGVIDYESLMRTDAETMRWPLVKSDAVKFMLYTSGTTGVAKGVMHTHEPSREPSSKYKGGGDLRCWPAAGRSAREALHRRSPVQSRYGLEGYY